MKRLIAAIISIALLALLFWRVDTAALVANLRSTNWIIFLAALLLFVPQTFAISWRWKRLVAPFAPLSIVESARMVLAGATMNLVLPGKLGDLTKGWFLARAGAVSTRLGLGVVVFEKMLDVATLAILMLFGVALIFLQHDKLPLPIGSLLLAAGLGGFAVCAVAILYFVPLQKLSLIARISYKAATDIRYAKLNQILTGSHNTMDVLRARGARRGEIIALSLLIWMLHLVQIYLFFLCLRTTPGIGEFFSMIPLAIFIGLLPISIAGFGTRDAALVALLPGLAPSAVLAASLYVNLRYIIPAIAGIPFLTRYAVKNKSEVSSPS